MLRKRTVFILGAGASAPYKFSTGRSQLNESRMHTTHHLSEMFAPISSTLAPKLEARLHKTGEPSIDAMLRADSPLLPAAKGIIARDLFRVEQAGPARDRGDSSAYCQQPKAFPSPTAADILSARIAR